MKKYIIIISVTGFFSCTKCKECTTTVTTDAIPKLTGYPQTVTSSFRACDEDLKSIDGNVSQAKTESYGYKITSTASTVCY